MWGPGRSTVGQWWQRSPPSARVFLAGTLLLAVTAVPSGLLMILDPTGETLGLDVEWLANSPFDDFAIPGSYLLVVLGFGSFAAVAAVLAERWWSWWLGVAISLALIAWIQVQLLVIGFVHPLQAIYGALGVILGVSAGWRAAGTAR